MKLKLKMYCLELKLFGLSRLEQSAIHIEYICMDEFVPTEQKKYNIELEINHPYF